MKINFNYIFEIFLFIQNFKYVVSDNIIIKKSEFKKLNILNMEINSSDLNDNEIIKISYPGYISYKIEVINGIHTLSDKTVYLDDKIDEPLTVEKEQILLYLTYDTWKIILICILVSFINFLTFYKLKKCF
ncbi:hypothetical protein DMUE_4435 [Dictyocoela muelleri]|nr:hypothetical protein DMUE_4435 [Dictyocoela muelleri]